MKFGLTELDHMLIIGTQFLYCIRIILPKFSKNDLCNEFQVHWEKDYFSRKLVEELQNFKQYETWERKIKFPTE